MDVELDHKEGWVLKNWCFWTVVLEKTLKSPLDCKEIQPVHPKGNKFWIFIGRTDAEAETPILWPPDVKSWLIGKDPDPVKDWGWEEKGKTEDAMVGWHHRLNGHGFGWTLGVGDGQLGLVCCGSWGRKQSDVTEWLNWTDCVIAVSQYSLARIKYYDFLSLPALCIFLRDFSFILHWYLLVRFNIFNFSVKYSSILSCKVYWLCRD